MVFSDDFRKKLNSVIALAVVVLAGLFVVLRFDIYYDLNDDVVMKDILSGIYSATPETRNMQMLYPLSFVLAVLYNLIPIIPWYGLMLGFFQTVCLYLIAKRCMEFCATITGKMIMGLTLLATFLGLFLYRFVFLHYTVTAGIMVATAVFRFMTNYSADPDEISFTQDTARVTKDDMPVGQFIRRNIINMLLLLTAFLLRSELALLMLPFIGVAFILKWEEERPVFTRENFEKFLSVMMIVVICGCLFWMVDNIAYGREQWSDFRELFGARTDIYDFTGIPSYEENAGFYESIDVSPEEYELLTTYNYNLADGLNHEKFVAIAEYAEELLQTTKSPAERYKEALWLYGNRYFSKDYRPFLLFNGVLMLLVLLVALLQKHFQIIWKLLLLRLFRLVPWLYLYYKGRVLERVTTPLFMVELLLLLAMLLMEFGIVVEQQNGYRTELRRMRVLSRWEERRENLVRVFPIIALLSLLAASVVLAPKGFKKTASEYENREQASLFTNAVNAYMDEHKDVYFLIDVYSSTSVMLSKNGEYVNLSEKVYADVSTNFGNYDILGGWIAKSPLYLDKLTYVEKKLVSQTESSDGNPASLLEELKPVSYLGYQMLTKPDHYQLLLRSDREADWLLDYFESIGTEVSLEQTDVIACDATDVCMNVYRVILGD